MKTNLTAFGAGLLFAIGLGLGGMLDANKVLGFLNILGHWDPSLAFVVAGAVLTHALAYNFIRRRERPVLASKFHGPAARAVTGRLVVGSVLFGIGWGLAGYCPGPALSATAAGSAQALVFTGFMFVGMALFQRISPKAQDVCER